MLETSRYPGCGPRVELLLVKNVDVREAKREQKVVIILTRNVRKFPVLKGPLRIVALLRCCFRKRETPLSASQVRNGKQPDPQLSTTVTHPAQGPGTGINVRNGDERHAHNGAHSSTIGWPEGEPTMRRGPSLTWFYRGFSLFYPIFPVYSPGRAEGLCAEFPTDHNRKERSRGAGRPLTVINLRTEPRGVCAAHPA